MDEERFASARENPRNIGFANCNNSNKSMPNDIAVQKPLATILDRFRVMLKKSEDELRASGDLVPSTEEIVRLYELVLSELSFNSKPIITDLTIIAGEQREHGEGIADAICARIIEVPVEIKLPSLYLLDSIVKNIGREYVRYFSSRLPEVFCEAYRQVHPNLHPSMRHLFGTWSAVFPTSVLRKIEAELEFSPSVNHQSSGLTPLRASESPRPTHGIHVNPKYLEARHQFEISTADTNIQHRKGTSSTSNVNGQNLAIGYDEDNTDVISSLVGAQRLNSSGRAGRTSFAFGAEKLPSTSAARLARSSSPFRIGHPRTLSPSIEEFALDSSPRRIAERGSLSHSGLENGIGRVTGREEDTVDWQRNHWPSDTEHKFESSAYYNYNNGVELQRPRALIDAYGNDRGKRILNNKHQVERLDINGIDSKVAPKTWQNTEEEEFDWEDMSPTLAGRDHNTDILLSSDPSLGSFRTRPGLGTHNAAPLEPNFRRRSTPAQLSVVDDSSVALEDAVPTIGSGRGSISKIPGFHNGTTQTLGSYYPQEAWNFPGNHPPSSQHQHNTKGSGRNFQMLFPGGISSLAGEQKPLIDSFPDASAQVHGSLTMGSRMGSSSLDLLNPEARSAAVSASTRAWPPVNMQKSLLPPLLNNLPPQKQIRSHDLMNSSNAFMNQSLNKSFFPEQQLHNIENKVMNSAKLPHFPSDQARPIPLNMRNPQQVNPLQQQQNLVPPAAVSMPSPLMVPPVNHGYTPQGHGSAGSAFLPNPIPAVHSSMPILNIPKSSMHFQGAMPPPPLPPGPPPASSQMMQPILQNPGLIVPNPPAGGAFSGLFNSLMAQGLISLTKQAPVQDSVGLEFDLDLLKVRHDSVLTALYADLPRQCKTCGLRFRSQEEHSTHMDWHVTKNRMSKNRKQKPSRKWFPSIDLWLSGAEALGTDAIPVFLPIENVMEKKDDEELAVPADEEQNVCALCGERFDDFYSDETEEWMYKGAVYMNAPDGSTAGMDRSQLGPIVHAKCRSESSAVPTEGFGRDEGGYTEEGSQRKRLRS